MGITRSSNQSRHSSALVFVVTASAEARLGGARTGISKYLCSDSKCSGEGPPTWPLMPFFLRVDRRLVKGVNGQVRDVSEKNPRKKNTERKTPRRMIHHDRLQKHFADK